MDSQHPFLPGGSGFSPFAAGSPQQQQVSAGLGASAGLGRYHSMNSPGLGFMTSPDQTSAAASPSMVPPVIAAAELLNKASSLGNGSFGSAGAPPSGYRSTAATLAAAAGRQLSSGNAFQNQSLQFYHHQQQSLGSPWRSLGRIDSSSEDVLAAAVAAAGLAPPPPPPPYTSTASPLNRASTVSAQQLLLQQQQLQQAALARSLSVDVGVMSAGTGFVGAGGSRWGGGRLSYDTGGLVGHDQGRFGSVYDMKSLTAALAHVQAGTGDVRRMLAACTFRPRLPGLTKLVSQMSREGHWAKALELYESLDAVAVRPDTTITNAAISACDKGGQWEKALQIFKSMSDLGMERDAITYSALISALSKGRQWGLAIDVFNHMVAEGVECDAVTCCSLITALDKGGQWQLAEQVFIQMYRHHPQFHVLLEGMDTDAPDAGTGADGQPGNGSNGNPERASSLLAGTFTTAALNALSISEDTLPPPEQLIAMMEASGQDAHKSSNGRDQADKPFSPGDQGAAAAAAGAASGKSTSYLAATLCKQSGYPHNTSGHVNTKGNGSGNISCDGNGITAALGNNGNGGSGCNTGNNTGATNSKGSASHCSMEVELADNSSAAAQSGTEDSTGSSKNCAPTAAATASTTAAHNITASSSNAVSTAKGSSSSNNKQDTEADVHSLDIQNTDTDITTLSCVWSRILASKAMAAAQASSPPGLRRLASTPGMHTTAAAATCGNNTTAATEGERAVSCSSDESLLTASDAVVHLMPAGKFRLIDAKSSGFTGPEEQHSTADDNTTPPAAGLSTAPALKPGTSAFAAAGAMPLDADVTGAHDQHSKGGPASPHSPPLHPTTHAGTGSALHTPGPSAQSSVQHGLSRAGSLGLISPGSASPARTGSGNMLRLGLTRSLNSKKSSPNRVCCNALLAAYARATPPRWRQALKLLDVMWQCGGELVPDIVSYNTVMKACGNAQQTDRAFELYQHMQQRGIEPTVATFGTLITIASEAQAYDKVKESWGWLQASGLPVHITCVNSYLTALIKEDNWDAAVDLFQQLKSNQLGVRPNSVTYNILMSACLARDRPQNVKGLFDEMTNANLSPTLISFNTLLQSYSKMNAWQDSLAVLHHMCTSSPVRPSTTSFNTVFGTLAQVAAGVEQADKQVLAARALDVYQAMTQLPGLHPDSTLYRTIVNALSACAAPKMVLQVALLMAQQGHTMDATSATAALDALQAERTWHLSGPLLAACLDAGIPVSQLLLQHILLIAVQDKTWRIAKEVLQVSSAAGQLDAVAQLLQQTRTALQSAQSGHSAPNQQLMQYPGLLTDMDGLDELLFLTYLQAQYNNGGWAEAMGLFKQLQQNRGASFAVCNGVLLGTLLELLVVRGGPQGTLEAVNIVDICHSKGVMSHYIPPPLTSTTGSSTTAGPSSPPASTATSAGLLSPEQQLIWQLESSNPAATAATSSSMGTFSLFPGMTSSAQPAPVSRASDLSGALTDFGQGAEGFAAAGLGPSTGPVPLSTLDVRGCSAIEALVLALSWLGQLVTVVGAGRPPACARLRVETGMAGPMDPVQALDLRLCYPVVPEGSTQGVAGASSSTSTASVTGGAAADARGDAPAGSEDDAPAAAVAAAVSTAPAIPVALSADPRAGNTSLLPAAGAAVTAHVSHHSPLQVPGSNLSVHTVVLALLSGQLGVMLDCKEPMDLLVAFSAAGRLPLGLVCLSNLPYGLPDELQGGGVEVDVAAASAVITSMLAAARGEGST